MEPEGPRVCYLAIKIEKGGYLLIPPAEFNQTCYGDSSEDQGMSIEAIEAIEVDRS